MDSKTGDFKEPEFLTNPNNRKIENQHIMQSKTDNMNFNESQGQKGCELFYVAEKI